MDTVSQERALLEERISVGILVPSNRPVLELHKATINLPLPLEPLSYSLRRVPMLSDIADY
jgi:hypothetical protein